MSVPSSRAGWEATAWVTAVVGGVIVAAAGAAPTGTRAWDALLVGLAAATVIWAAAQAPPWATIAAATVAATVNATWLALAVLVLAIAVVFVGTAVPVAARTCASVSVALSLVTLARAGDRWFFGATALAAVCVGGGLLAAGIAARPPTIRRRAGLAVAGVAGLAVLATVVAGIGLLQARSRLTTGDRLARAGLQRAQFGDTASAAELLRRASAEFGSVDSGVDLFGVGRLVPVVAQHRRAVDRVGAAGDRDLAVAAEALATVDVESVRVVDGAIDVDAVSALAGPLATTRDIVDDLLATVADAHDPWLLPAVERRLDGIAIELADRSDMLDRTRRAVEVAPTVLGADRPRRYFVAFVTPAEQRGLGGFMGNWAEVVVADGRIRMTRFGADEDLNVGGPDPEQRRMSDAADFLRLYGQYGFVQPDGTTGLVPWKNITMSPDLPSVAAAIAELYPQSGGQPIDGVYVLDTAAIAALTRLTGPIVVDGTALGPSNTEEFLLRGQYLLGKDRRLDVLDEIARTVVDRLLTGALPEPTTVARVFGPLAQTRSLMAWDRDPDVQAVFAEAGMDGTLAAWIGDDELVVSMNNGGGNKIDAYAELTVDSDESGGVVVLRNGAPSTGLPSYVIGNLVGLPSGTSRTILTFYTRRPVLTVLRDGSPVEAAHDVEVGLYTTIVVADVAAGSATTIELSW